MISVHSDREILKVMQVLIYARSFVSVRLPYNPYFLTCLFSWNSIFSLITKSARTGFQLSFSTKRTAPSLEASCLNIFLSGTERSSCTIPQYGYCPRLAVQAHIISPRRAWPMSATKQLSLARMHHPTDNTLIDLIIARTSTKHSHAMQRMHYRRCAARVTS